MKVVDEAFQLFGGAGTSREYPIEKLFRDARAALIEDGENYVLTMRLGLLAQQLYAEGWSAELTDAGRHDIQRSESQEKPNGQAPRRRLWRQRLHRHADHGLADRPADPLHRGRAQREARAGDDGAARRAPRIGHLRDRRDRAQRRRAGQGVQGRQGRVQYRRPVRELRPDRASRRRSRPAATTSTRPASRATCARCATSSASRTARPACSCRPRSRTCTRSRRSPPNWRSRHPASTCWRPRRCAAGRAAAPRASPSARRPRSSSCIRSGAVLPVGEAAGAARRRTQSLQRRRSRTSCSRCSRLPWGGTSLPVYFEHDAARAQLQLVCRLLRQPRDADGACAGPEVGSGVQAPAEGAPGRGDQADRRLDHAEHAAARAHDDDAHRRLRDRPWPARGGARHGARRHAVHLHRRAAGGSRR